MADNNNDSGGTGIRVRARNAVVKDNVVVGCPVAFDVDVRDDLTMSGNKAVGCGSRSETKQPSMGRRFRDALKEEGPKAAISLIAAAAMEAISRS